MNKPPLRKPPRPGSRWTRKGDGVVVRVMTIADSWIMARIPHCVPFVVHTSDWFDVYEPLNPAAEEEMGQ